MTVKNKREREREIEKHMDLDGLKYSIFVLKYLSEVAKVGNDSYANRFLVSMVILSN